MIVCGTGHRPHKLGGYGRPAYDLLVSVAELWLKNVKVDRVISGMALGWDQALVSACVRLDIPYCAYIPFIGQESAWPESSQNEYRFMLERAREVVVCSDGAYAAWKMQHRNKRMVDDSDVVLAMFNRSKGGTANCVKYAEGAGKQVVNLWPVWNLIYIANSTPKVAST